MKNLIFVLLFIPAFIFAQELKVRVNVNFEQLPNSGKERLSNFKSAIEDYLSNTKFTDMEYETPIDCNFSIFFISNSNETHFSAQVVITSQRPIYNSPKNSLMLRIQDSNWEFDYEQNQTLYFNQSDFDPLTSFLDFYAYLIIGTDMDSYEPLGGNNMFNRAMEISVLGGNSAYSKGWLLDNSSYNKRKLIHELQSATFQQFRENYFNYHYNGLDLYSQNKQAAMKNMAKLVNDLAKIKDNIDPRSVLMKVFFDAKHREIADYLKNSPDKTIYDKLVKIDPSHLSYYRKTFEGIE